MPAHPNLLLLETRLTAYNTAAARDVAYELRNRSLFDNRVSDPKLELIDELLTFWETHHAAKKPA